MDHTTEPKQKGVYLFIAFLFDYSSLLYRGAERSQSNWVHFRSHLISAVVYHAVGTKRRSRASFQVFFFLIICPKLWSTVKGTPVSHRLLCWSFYIGLNSRFNPPFYKDYRNQRNKQNSQQCRQLLLSRFFVQTITFVIIWQLLAKDLNYRVSGWN